MNRLFQLDTKSAMSISRIFVLTIALLHPLGIIDAQVNDNRSSIKPPEVEIAGSHLLKINSSITGQEYVLHINLPQHYDDTSKTFPVIYLVDSQWDFSLVTAIYGDQYFDGFIPAAIIAGITWGGENPNYDKRRAFDLTPTDNNQPSQFGNAEKFLSFIKKEAIPFVESKYRAKNNERTLVGHSFGGLFTLYALFAEPELFHHYVAGSPAWMWDNASLYKYAEKFSNIKLSHPIRLYMMMGEYEDVLGFDKLTATIKGYTIKGLEVEAQVIKGSGHAGTKPEGYNRGLQYVFRKPCLNLDNKILEHYVGEYEVNSQFHIKIVREDNQLVGIAPGNQRIPVCAETEEDFYINGQFSTFHFQKDTTGKVTGFHMERYEGGSFVKKVE
jgi:predicted alpha/beta superfamily hydrolase